MTIGPAEGHPTADAERLHEYFLDIKRSRSVYNGFLEVPFSSKAHDISRVSLPYHADAVRTAELVGTGVQDLAANYESEIIPAVTDLFLRHSLGDHLQEESLIVSTNHFDFNDMTLLGAAWMDVAVRLGIYPDVATAASHNYAITSRFVDTLALGTVDKPIVENILRHLFHVIRTLPDTESGKATSILTKPQRDFHNIKTISAVKRTLRTPGNVLFMAAGGAHDLLFESPEGQHMFLQPVDKSTARILAAPDQMVLFALAKCAPAIRNGSVVADKQAFITDLGMYEPCDPSIIHQQYASMARHALKWFQGHGLPELVSVDYLGDDSLTGS